MWNSLFRRISICSLMLLLASCVDKDNSVNTSEGRNINSSPTVEAGTSQTVNEQTTVSLNAVASDTDGSIDNVSWVQTGGTTVVLDDSSKLATSFIAPDVSSEQILSFEITVEDDDGATAKDTVTVTVQAVNSPPTVDAGQDQVVDELTTVNLTGTAVDVDGKLTVINGLKLAVFQLL